MNVKILKRAIVLSVLLACYQFVFAQSVSVKGVVTDVDGVPLAGVSITEKGTTKGTMTNVNGEYNIKVSSKESVLSYSYMGFATLQQKVDGREKLDIKLSSDTKQMNEVVVIGYGTVQRKDLTGSVSSVKGEELSKVPVQDVASALVGRLAGVQVNMAEGAPGADISIKVRGGGSITQSNEPLYVIDGIPQTEGLSFLDPTDVESIDVLKDASSTAIYGARGANGVILVTTKQAKAGKTRVTYDTYLGAKKNIKELEVLNPYQYTLLQYERSLDDATRLQSFTTNYGTFDQLESLYAGREGVNWQKEVFGGTANSQYHKVGVSGGDKNTTFNMFYSFNNDEGIMLNSGAKKNVAKVSLNHKASDRLKVNASVNYSDVKVYGIGTGEGNNYFNQLQNILTYRPTFGLKGADDDLIGLDEDPALAGDSGNTLQNPRTNAESQHRDVLNKVLYISGGLEYKLYKNITYKGLVNYRTGNTKNSIFYDSRSMIAKRKNNKPSGSLIDQTKNGWNYANTLSYSNTFNKVHKLDVLVGQEQNYSIINYNKINASGFPKETLGMDKLSEAAEFTAESDVQDERMFSLFSRVNYSYKDRYLFAASLRADGSSKFGSGNKYGYFPAASFGWRIIEEDFMKDQHVFSDLKLRLSVGTSGNNRIKNYTSLALLNTGSYYLNDINNVTVYSNTLPNPNLKWEQTRSENIGLDMSFLNHKIELTAEVYRNTTKDLLLSAEVPLLSGYTNMIFNAGSTRNTGLEFTLNTTNISTKDFKWNTTFNIAFNKNKVLGLADGEQFRYASSGWGALSETDYIVRVGQPLGQIYGYQSNGLYQIEDFDYDAGNNKYTLKPGIPYDVNNVPQPGFLKLVNQNEDNVIDINDRVVIGNAYPIHIGGLNNTFSYKGFDLSVFLNWSYGNDVYNANKLYSSQTRLDYRNALSYFGDRWMSIDNQGVRITDPVVMAEVNKGKTVPVYNGTGTDIRLYDKMIEDGSFLRINNISLGYNLPKTLTSKLKVGTVRVYATGYNIATITGYSGYDPEVSTRNSTGLTPGVDFGAYPRARSFVAGLNLSF